MATKQITKATRDKIVAQARKEIEHARVYKSDRVSSSWQRNDELLARKKKDLEGVRSNINIAATKAKGFVNTMMSRVDSAPNIKYGPGETADLKKAKRANALIEKDTAPANGNLAFKDLMAKKHGTKYGRGIFEYHASSVGGYKSFWTLINPKDFLIDPEAGGLDIEKAKYLGRTNIVKTKKQLQDGKKSGEYIKHSVDQILKNEMKQDETEDEKEKRNRFYIMRNSKKKRLQRDDEWIFTEWGTTYQGTRYYVLLHENIEEAIKLKEYKEVFESNLWSFASFATDPDDDEFWTLGPLDDVIEIFMGQHVLVNQQIDNNEQINQPMKGYDTGAIKNPAMLKWRRNGNIPFKKGTNMDKAFKVYTPIPLTTNIPTYNLLDNIAATESGITPDVKGLSEEQTLGIYEGNLRAAAERLGLLNKSYADCYNRLGLLYYNGLKEHLNEKISIKMIGNKGIEYEEISKTEIIPGGKEFDVMITSSDVGLNSETTESRNKVTFLDRYREDPTKNQNVIFEIEAELVGIDPELIRRIQDVDNFGNAELISEAAADFQKMLGGETLEPNPAANTAYKQYFVDELVQLSKNIKPEIEKVIVQYIVSIEDIVIRNTVRAARQQIAKEALQEPTPEVTPEVTPKVTT